MHHHWPNIRSLKKTAAWETCLTQWNATKDFSTDQRHSAGIEDTIGTYNLTLHRQTSRVWRCTHKDARPPVSARTARLLIRLRIPSKYQHQQEQIHAHKCIYSSNWMPPCQPELHVRWLTRHTQYYYQQAGTHRLLSTHSTHWSTHQFTNSNQQSTHNAVSTHQSTHHMHASINRFTTHQSTHSTDTSTPWSIRSTRSYPQLTTSTRTSTP